MPCVFLGYSQSQKGYKLNLLTKHIFDSRDVTFVEHIFPYNSTSDAQCKQPLPSVTFVLPSSIEDLVIFAPSPSPSSPSSSLSHPASAQSSLV